MADRLPEDILADIFFRLPAKTVLDCRCVSKRWCSVISNSDFIYKYNQLSFSSKKHTRLILARYHTYKREEIITLHNDDDSFGEHIEEFEFPFDNGLSNYMLIGLCSGLVCFLEITKAETLPKSILIWNPSVGYSFKTFPIQPPVSKIHHPYFEYGTSVRSSVGKALVSIFGFAFDPRSFDYKVVRIVYRLVGSKRVLEIIDVLALSVGEWENITNIAPPYIIKDVSGTASVNGAIHWIGYYHGDDERLISKLTIVVFDLYDEVFKEFKLPRHMMEETVGFGHEGMQKISVGVIHHSLAVLHYSNPRTDLSTFNECSVWVMNEYGSTDSWTKLFNIHFPNGSGKIVGIRKNGDILGVEAQKWELCSCNLDHNSFKNLNIYGCLWSFYMEHFMECLVIYKKVNGVPTMSTYLPANTSQHALCVGPSGVKISEEGEEIMEEEEQGESIQFFVTRQKG